MIKVSIIGSGNVAQHLTTAFKNNPAVALQQVFARNAEKAADTFRNIEIISDLTQLREADVYILAVSDEAVHKLSNEFAFEKRLVVHTSGSIPMSAINSKNRQGVFYPLQTFSATKTVDFSHIPVCIEAKQENDINILEELAKSVTDQIYRIDSKKRLALHLAAVFASNFTNHMYKIANDICTDNNLPFDILKPLIMETAAKVMSISPEKAQTGPAKRHDQITIGLQQTQLKDSEHLEIYNLLTNSIQHGGKKL